MKGQSLSSGRRQPLQGGSTTGAYVQRIDVVDTFESAQENRRYADVGTTPNSDAGSAAPVVRVLVVRCAHVASAGRSA